MSDHLEEQLHRTQNYWDSEAESFDVEPDHGLRNPDVLAAWKKLLVDWQPKPTANILDIGCGTGSLSLILAQQGHKVTGIDLSPKMIAQAKVKAAKANLDIEFIVMGAERPNLPQQSYNGIVCRHVLWILPDLKDVLERWTELLQTGSRILIVEGFWHPGSGLHAEELLAAIPSSWQNVKVVDLSKNSKYWGKDVKDERYALMAEVV